MDNTSMQTNKPLRMGVRQAAAMLGLTEPALRQLVLRRPELLPVQYEKTTEAQKRGRMTLAFEDVELFYSRKKHLPPLSRLVPGAYLDLYRACGILLMSTPRVLRLLQNRKISGGVTMDGQVLLSAASVRAYATGETTNDASDL